MVLTFFGLKYVEDSIASPVENSSGAITAVLCFLILHQKMSLLSLIAVIFVTLGVVFLGLFQARGESESVKKVGKKLAIIGFIMTVLYSVFNAIGGLLDAYFLDLAVTPLHNVTENTIELVANTSYELTYLIIAVIFTIFIYLRKEKMNWLSQKDKFFASIFETFGQLMYVFAMSGNAIIAAPIVSSVCVVSVILARIFLKEKMTKKQYLAILSVIVGILILAVTEG
jgi:drug/metabolite transporter (DMT)-like permease